MRRFGTIIVAAVVGGLALAGCAPSVPEAEPDIRGVVTEVSARGDDGVSLRVVWTDDAALGVQAGYDAAQVTVSGDTEVLSRAIDGSVAAAGADDIAVGTVVEAWFTGAVAESYPVQATVRTIVITGRYSGELPEPPGMGE